MVEFQSLILNFNLIKNMLTTKVSLILFYTGIVNAYFPNLTIPFLHSDF